MIRALLIFFLASLSALAGTFSKVATLIPVAPNVHLDANVYIPEGAVAPMPVVVIIHGFGGSKNDGVVVALAGQLAGAGYVVLTPSARGFGNSDGLVTLAGPNEINDLQTMILAMQTGVIGDSPPVPVPVTTNSLFGVAGASYGGGHSFEIMRTHVAGLATVVPIIGWTDLYQALCPNDVPKLAYSVGLFASGFDPRNPNYDDVMFDWMRELLGGAPELTRTGDAVHNIDWRSVRFEAGELTVPAFVIQGWRDGLFPAEQATALFATNTAIPFFKLYLGGLGHPPATTQINGAEGLYLRDQLIRWFDFWLKGVETGITNEPAVTIAPANTADWSAGALIGADTFPLPGTSSTTYFFNNNALSTAGPAGLPRALRPTSGGGTVLTPLRAALGGTADQLMAALLLVNQLLNAGGGVLDSSIVTKPDTGANGRNFTSPPLAGDLRVVGLPEFRLFVSAAASNAHYYVQIYERLPNGNAKLVTRGAFKDHAGNFAEPHEIVFSPFAVHHVFKAGSAIRVRVASRDFPFFLPNLQQPKAKIYRDAIHPSSVTLPVVPD